MNLKLSIVLPCYNEAATLPLLLKRYRDVWEDLPAELILVNNGSTDATAAVLERELRRPEYTFARSVLVPRNIGYGHGIWMGLRAAKGEVIAFSHADLQCSPADPFTAFHRLQREARSSSTVVKGRRARRGFKDEAITHGMGLLASTVLLTELTDINAQPKVFHRCLLKHLIDPPLGFQFDLYILYKARQGGFTVVTIPVVFGRREHGTSKWSFHFFSRYRTILATILYIFQLRLGFRW